VEISEWLIRLVHAKRITTHEIRSIVNLYGVTKIANLPTFAAVEFVREIQSAAKAKHVEA
jgi:hypothetical protein